MSQENVEIVKRGWEHFLTTGEQPEEIIASGFVWDMSTFRDLMGLQQQYEGVEGIRRFLQDWTEFLEEWQFEVESFHDAGDRVVAVCRQRGRSKMGGVAC